MFSDLCNELIEVGNDTAVEGLVHLIDVAGPHFDHPQTSFVEGYGRSFVEEIILKLQKLLADEAGAAWFGISTRVRYMVLDLVDRRENGWDEKKSLRARELESSQLTSSEFIPIS